MSSDPRSSFVRGVEEKLAGVLSPSDLESVVHTIMTVLSDFEIADRCTEVAVCESENAKFLNRYCACMLVDGKSQRTIYQYRRQLIRIADSLQKNYRDMTAYDIRYYLACEKQRGLSNVSLENTRSYISAFFQWMFAEEIINKNPAAAVNTIKCPQEIKVPFTDVEIDAIRSACRSLKDRAIVEMLLSTGVRISELAQMDIEDIDFATLTVNVRHGKGDKARTTYTTKVAALHLKRYLQSRKDDSSILFLNVEKTRLLPNGFRHILGEIAKRAGLSDVHPHRFRRTFASGLAARGMDIQKIQRLLGHANINTTMRYIHVDDVQVKASYEQYIA